MDRQASEDRIQLAIQALEAGTVSSQRKAAHQFKIPPSTLRDRINGVRSSQAYHQSLQRLTVEEEEAIKRCLCTLTAWGWPATIRYLKSLALGLLRAKGDQEPLGHNWYKNYLKRHLDLKATWSRTLDQARKDAVNHATLEQWFKLYEQTCIRYGISASDQYNMDEKGFMKGIGDDPKVIIPVNEEEAWSNQPGNREWVSIICCISANGYSLPSFFIFQGQRIQHSWLDAQVDERSVIRVSKNGWTTQTIALEWLEHFNAHTKQRLTGRYRLLILDGHTSHISLPFIEYCEHNEIIPLCLPPHSTHILQPLDVGVFSPLTKAYKTRIHDHALFGTERITNEQFLSFFQLAFNSAFNRQNIQSAWRGTGLQPFKPELLLAKYRPKTPPIASLTSSTGIRIDVLITEPELAQKIDEVIARILKVCPSQVEDITFVKETCLTAIAEKTALTEINQQLLNKAQISRQKRTKKHFGEARLLTVQEAREKQAQREREEMQRMTEKERKAALRGVITFAKLVWRDLKMDQTVFD